MATKITSVALDAHFSAFAEQQVANGDYGSTDDVVRAGLRLLEEQAGKLARLRAALIEGEQSGPAEPWDFEAFKERMRAERHATR